MTGTRNFGPMGAGKPLESLFAGLKQAPGGPFSGLSGALSPMLLARLAVRGEATLLVVNGSDRALRLAQETRTWLGPAQNRAKLFLPERESWYDQTPIPREVSSERTAAIGLDSAGGGLVIATVPAVCERFFAPRRWAESVLVLSVGTTLSLRDLTFSLAGLGYTRTSQVQAAGQFAVRGGILDVFSPHQEFPVRLDFFGDEIETIKTFSVETQRTLDKLAQTAVVPALEHFMDGVEREGALAALNAAAGALDPTRRELLERRIERFCLHPDSRDVRELLPFLGKGTHFLWEHWHQPRVLIEDPDQIGDDLETFLEQQERAFSKASELTPLLPPGSYFHSPAEILAGLRASGAAAFSRFKRDAGSGLVFEVEPVAPPSDPSRETLVTDLNRWMRDGWAVTLIISDPDRFHNLKGLLGERKIPVYSGSDPMKMAYGAVLMLCGSGRRGFIANRDRIAVLGEEDIYPHQAKSVAHPRTRVEKGLLEVSQLVPGDLVVHADHGIAQFGGIHPMTAGGNTREYLLLNYAGTDKLYVPADQVHKVQKYIGMEGARPLIHSLNSKVWENQKRRVQKHVETIARELLELYARRQLSHGFAFLPDNDLQREMEGKFAFTETPDQAKAISATKADMEAAVPMDRLICGDVGYGKTEVAIRAAFKAVNSGKQVAVLAPTTLLAFQHFQTFNNRLQGFPVTVDMVSRLRKPVEQKKTIDGVKGGRVDILVGTHRLLSSDIGFRELGLLIVDEEQRFGVKHKEKLKALKASIDVLTLSATPIPRTLQMALSGIRQISVIDTPPEDRRPVHTYVAPFDQVWAKRAVIEELKRGGQVYYVFNRVEKIDQKAEFLRNLVPEARIAIAHGQMDETLVEKTMLAFIQGEYDLLLATTIIESGLDIPNVNTLIVDEAERLGLSQMYQLRGRVGRSNRQAWAYFFYSKGKRLTQEAQERLSTIEEHTALGSGFKIALRDLQIRGAGNLLGEEQSGHIAAVGFALYIELLEEAVGKLRGVSVPKPSDSAIEIPVTALFPMSYVGDEDTRFDLYARIARCTGIETLELLRAECEDRFGRLPEEGNSLFRVARLRLLAGKSGVKKITRVMNRLRFEFDRSPAADLNDLVALRTAFWKRISFSQNDPFAVFVQLKDEEGTEVLDTAENFLMLSGADGAAVSKEHMT